jgi:peroxiredoxin
MSVQVGSPAPGFKLFSSEKKEVSLSDYQGKNVVLLFFPSGLYRGMYRRVVQHER